VSKKIIAKDPQEIHMHKDAKPTLNPAIKY